MAHPGTLGTQGRRGIPILAPLISTFTAEDGLEREHLVGFKIVYVLTSADRRSHCLPRRTGRVPGRTPNYRNACYLCRQPGHPGGVEPLGRDIQGLSTGGGSFWTRGQAPRPWIMECPRTAPPPGVGGAGGTGGAGNWKQRGYLCSCPPLWAGRTGKPDYILLHGATKDMLYEHLERICNTAAEIISALENG